MERILPVGSVVNHSGKKVLLLGSVLKEENGKLVHGYMAVRYPLGYVSIDSLGFAPETEIEEVFARGYEDDVGARYNEKLTKLQDAMEGKSQAEADQLMQMVGEEIKSATEKLRDNPGLKEQ